MRREGDSVPARLPVVHGEGGSCLGR
jgi:hypothetical protein